MTAATIATNNAAQQALFGRIMMDPYAAYYPSHWPAMPFHRGELALQRAAEVHDLVMTYAPKVIRPYLPDQHRAFYANQPFLVVAARDLQGNMWSTLLTSPSGQADLVTSPDPVTLLIHGRLVKGDALQNEIKPGSDMGLLGIELATKRRNRVNGRVTAVSDHNNTLVFSVDQTFGNCPQYIKPREWWTAAPLEDDRVHETVDSLISPDRSSQQTTELSSEQIQTIAQAETMFVATGYRGDGKDVRFGNDASHRGGPSGFVMVRDSRTLVLPEFAGNNHFNSLGNLQLDNRMGVTIPCFETGGMLQLSGTATVDMDKDKAAKTYPGALYLVTFHIEHVNQVAAGSLPVRWSTPAHEERRLLQVKNIVQESVNVKSFYLGPQVELGTQSKPLWEFTAGQHLPIQLQTKNGEVLRTYSLSGSPGGQGQNPDYYRISVKRETKGVASGFLYDHVSIGDTILVNRPAGDFVLLEHPKEKKGAFDDDQTLVLLSSGIGVTPILSMLHQFVETNMMLSDGQQERGQGRHKVVWIHGARDGDHHPFRDEVWELVNKAKKYADITTHTVYSRPTKGDASQHYYNSTGRINIDLIQSLVPDLQRAVYFMCGNGAFMADIEDGLYLKGVNLNHVHFETF